MASWAAAGRRGSEIDEHRRACFEACRSVLLSMR
jgi:hypothetical protein